MRFAQTFLAALLVPLAAVAAATAGGGSGSFPPGYAPKNAAAAQRIAEKRRAVDLINQASRHVFAVRPSCRPNIPAKSSVTHDAPTQPVLDAISALRRPATAADMLDPFAHFGDGEVYVDYRRSATAASGRKFTIVISRSVRPSFRISASCLDAEHTRLLELLAAEPKHLRSVTLREFGKLRQGQEQNSAQPTAPQDGIYVFTRNPDGSGGGGGGGTIKEFLDRGAFNSQGGRSGTELDGLVPDGVASVTLEFAKSVSRGPDFKPAVYPSSYTRTVKVQENVLSLHVPRRPDNAFPQRMVWRAADGSVLHVIKTPR